MIHPSFAAKHLCEKSNWTLTNLKLQKLLYLADMNYVGNTGERLLSEDFEAWDYGPVLPSVYHSCKSFGSKPVPDIFWGVGAISGSVEAQWIDVAWETLKDQTPGQLVDNTHWDRGAWAKKYVPGAKGLKIVTGDMIEEYRNRVG
jgi:uncharacterized phage-associated protein